MILVGSNGDIENSNKVEKKKKYLQQFQNIFYTFYNI